MSVEQIVYIHYSSRITQELLKNMHPARIKAFQVL